MVDAAQMLDVSDDCAHLNTTTTTVTSLNTVVIIVRCDDCGEQHG